MGLWYRKPILPQTFQMNFDCLVHSPGSLILCFACGNTAGKVRRISGIVPRCLLDEDKETFHSTHPLHILIHEASLLEYAVQSSEREIITRIPGNGPTPNLGGAFVLAMASLVLHPALPILLKHLYDITDFH
jgi:hypothetical protein